MRENTKKPNLMEGVRWLESLTPELRKEVRDLTIKRISLAIAAAEIDDRFRVLGCPNT